MVAIALRLGWPGDRCQASLTSIIRLPDGLDKHALIQHAREFTHRRLTAGLRTPIIKGKSFAPARGKEHAWT